MERRRDGARRGKGEREGGGRAGGDGGGERGESWGRAGGRGGGGSAPRSSRSLLALTATASPLCSLARSYRPASASSPSRQQTFSRNLTDEIKFLSVRRNVVHLITHFLRRPDVYQPTISLIQTRFSSTHGGYVAEQEF